MRVFLEGQAITESDIHEFIPMELSSYVTKDKIINLVGYIKNRNGRMCIVLPKVFSDEFVGNFNNTNEDTSSKNWLDSYAILLYRILKKYDSNLRLKNYISEKIDRTKKVGTLDAILDLIGYYNKHSYLYTLKKKNSNSVNPMNANWSRLIVKGTGRFIDDELFFDSFLNSKWRYSEEDFLLMLLNTEINNIAQRYGLIKKVEGAILSQKDYRNFLKKPLTLLKRAKRNYYRDDFLKLYKALYGYYSQCEIQNGKSEIEYLVTGSFQLVFEDMVDDLLSTEEMVDTFKYNKDGKIIDHIYSYKDAFGGIGGVYIGDSKYYKDDSDIAGQRWKQYSYARNVANYISISAEPICIRLKRFIQDDRVYGYYPIPNFFISAYVENDPIISDSTVFFKYNDIQKPCKTQVYENRLFDRDTQHVLYFQINLIHLGNKYLEGWTVEQKNLIKEYIRSKWISYLTENYEFWVFDDTVDIETFIKSYYFDTYGKFVYDANNCRYIFATEVGKGGNILSLLNMNSISGTEYCLS
ncbi:hypothetical protein [Butyrivibrio sp. MB2005]|uniref:hypothetical protein n=1 Tax=Butyrivibrio sp. MB2005 TaxID=1280678 RepID=UPI0003FACCB4|nr:hypothetical protein [Butyrivibrio sp. MB2005]